MPTLPLHNLSTLDGRVLSLFRISAVMGSPNDAAERGEFLVAGAAKAMSEAPHPAFEALFHEQGSFGGVAEARPFSKLQGIWSDRIDDWFVTSLMTNLLCRLSNGQQVVSDQTSVNKAAFMLERQRGHGNADALAAIPRNRNEIVKIWGRYRSVAHLCAAMITSSFYMTTEIFRGFVRSGLPLILSNARIYQDWGLSQQLPRIRRTILTRPDLWEIPSGLPLPRSTIGLTSLTPLEIELLKEYRAPTPRH